MVDKRKLIGNEVLAGGKPAHSNMRRANKVAVANFENLRLHRQQLIRYAAEPRRFPVPARLAPAVQDSPTFNQVAYSLLLISVLAILGTYTSLLNWAFLAYGLFAVVARLPSSSMFVSALICLVLIPITTTMQRAAIANNFAVITFYFLLIGLVRACLELRRDNMPQGPKGKS